MSLLKKILVIVSRIIYFSPELLYKFIRSCKTKKWSLNFFQIIISCLFILKVARFANLRTQKSNHLKKGGVCFVLGNGPSLKNETESGYDYLKNQEIFCVNDFVKSELFEKVKPKYYVIADPGNWSPVNTEEGLNARNSLFEAIVSKTTWPLIMYVPFQAKDYLETKFIKNKNIHLKFFNVSASNFKDLAVLFTYSIGVCMPRAQNVLIAALYLAIYNEYKKIILLGADHSWHETLALDEKNNVCMRSTYFFDKSAADLKPWYKDYDYKDVWNMPDLFQALGLMFQGYWSIKDYASFECADIYNASSNTYIDAFKRVKLSEILDADCNK